MNKLEKYMKDPSNIILFAASRGLFNFLSDEQYIRLMYLARLHKKINLSSPETFNEKLNWLKLHDRNPEYTKLVDKYSVKAYVADLIGEDYIIPTLGVWERFEDIDFDSLPGQFVLKCTHDSGGLVIVRDKDLLNRDAAGRKINRSLRRNYYLFGREWPYKDVPPRIIAEQYMEDHTGSGLTNYKFLCFRGNPLYLYVSKGMENHDTAQISFLTMDWKFAEFMRTDYPPLSDLPPKPQNFEKMVDIARCLSADKTFVRVDLYSCGDRIYFGELTFFPTSGMIPFSPKEWDAKLGQLIPILPSE